MGSSSSSARPEAAGGTSAVITPAPLIKMASAGAVEPASALRVALSDALLPFLLSPLVDIVFHYANFIPLTFRTVCGDFNSGMGDEKDGRGADARLFAPQHTALWRRSESDAGPMIVVVDKLKRSVRVFNPESDYLSTLPVHFVGTREERKQLALMTLINPIGIAVDPSTNDLLVTSWSRLSRWHGRVYTTIAGSQNGGRKDGIGEAAEFTYAAGIVCSSDGQFCLVADNYNDTIRRVGLATRAVTTVAGKTIKQFRIPDVVPASQALLSKPYSLCWDARATVPCDSAIFITGQTAVFRFDLRSVSTIVVLADEEKPVGLCFVAPHYLLISGQRTIHSVDLSMPPKTPDRAELVCTRLYLRDETLSASEVESSAQGGSWTGLVYLPASVPGGAERLFFSDPHNHSINCVSGHIRSLMAMPPH